MRPAAAGGGNPDGHRPAGPAGRAGIALCLIAVLAVWNGFAGGGQQADGGVAAGSATSAGGAPAGPITVIFAGTEAATTGQSRMMRAVADRLNATGRFAVTVQVAGALSDDADTLVAQAERGAPLVVPSDPGRLASLFDIPDLNILMAPYVLTDPLALRKLPGTALFKEWEAALERKGITYLANMYNGFRSFYTITPVTGVADLAGLRVRGFGNAIGNALARRFDFINVGISWGEVYTSIRDRTLDGCEVQVATAAGARLWEVTRYLALTRHYMLQTAFVCSSAFHDAMPPADRALFDAAMRETAAEYSLIIEREEAGYYDLMREHGVTVIEVDMKEFEAAVAPLYANNDLGFSEGLRERLFREIAE